MRVEFSSQSSRDGLNPSANTARLVNLYREPLMPGGKGGFQLRSVLGMQAFADLDRVFMRALTVFGDRLHAICGGSLYRMTTAGTVSELATVGQSAETSVAANTGYLTIAAAGNYYAWNGSALTTPATGAITDVGSVSYLGGYTVLTELGGRRIQWSALVDPTNFSGLDFASAETTDKPIIRGVVWRDVMMVFKEASIEQWTRTGQAGPDAFARIPGADLDIGLRGYGLVTTFPAGMAFASSDGKVMLWNGQMQPISIPPVEVALSEYDPQRMFYYERRGHGFICITFRNAPAWCYDLATGEWHERDENGAAWMVTASVKWGSAWFVGADTGKIARLTARTVDFGVPIIRRAVSLPVINGEPFIMSRLELFPRMGMDRQADGGIELDDDVALLVTPGGSVLGDDGADPREAQISIKTSRDGVTFGPEKVRSLGLPGRYDLRAIWRGLGQFRSIACIEVRLTSVTDIPLISSAEVTVT